ncbi:Hsp70 family protein [Schaalia sp. 19OD2882]|uniref:Hsp70 family protein n=1 Tax=Schaalia sp. 19OD2882 TaxID=2794089 RepID=UPI001C1F1AD2|nr:Hsp70 family protein [Schaalia sp. 19OD2882]QWW18682.1 Hsp70 family protein [Schaalia sp. 19OD2882]
MRIGVDFGTTRTTIACVDRGNYPMVSFEDESGDLHDYIPSVAALDGNHLVFGHEAERLASDGAAHLRSFKRLLADAGVTPSTTVRLARRDIGLVDLLTRFLAHVAQLVRESSSVATVPADEPLEAVVGVPAHAHSGQRFLTMEAFRAAGWNVLSMVNEPSAAGFEYTHRHSGTLNSRRTKVLVYDLGGGTFDASLVVADGVDHEVLASRGNNLLGGDDFDLVLARLALRSAGLSPADLGDEGWDTLVHQCRLVKESLTPQSRFATIDVQGSPVILPVRDYYEEVRPLVDSTLETMTPLLDLDAQGASKLAADVAGLYVVGGGAELPAVARILRDAHGRRVHRSPHPAASTAIGLAIAADPAAAYTLRDTLSRGVGVFREAESGDLVSFDPLLEPDLVLARGEDVHVVRRYRAAHNVGWFRFVEYSRTDSDGVPRGDVIPCGEVFMPFDRQLQGAQVDLSRVEVVRTEDGPLVEERYTVDRNGIVTVEIVDVETGWSVGRNLGKL